MSHYKRGVDFFPATVVSVGISDRFSSIDGMAKHRDLSVSTFDLFSLFLLFGFLLVDKTASYDLVSCRFLVDFYPEPIFLDVLVVLFAPCV